MQLEAAIRKHLVGLPYVTVGRGFGGEAFFYRGRFFCHFHPARDHFFLETFVWNRVEDVIAKVPGVIAHPEYGNYGWVRLPIVSEEDMPSAIRLVDMTYECLRTTKRVSVRKERFSSELLDALRERMGPLTIKVKEAKKTMQILMQVPDAKDYDEAEKLLSKAAAMLKT